MYWYKCIHAHGRTYVRCMCGRERVYMRIPKYNNIHINACMYVGHT